MIHARWAMLGVMSLLLSDISGSPFPPKEVSDLGWCAVLCQSSWCGVCGVWEVGPRRRWHSQKVEPLAFGSLIIGGLNNTRGQHTWQHHPLMSLLPRAQLHTLKPLQQQQMSVAALAPWGVVALLSLAFIETYRLAALWDEEDFEKRTYPGGRVAACAGALRGTLISHFT